MHAEFSLQPSTVHEHIKGGESLGQQSVNQFRHELRGAVVFAYNFTRSGNAGQFIDEAVTVMSTLRPEQEGTIEYLAQDLVKKVENTEMLLADPTSKVALRGIRADRSDFPKVVAANALNLMTEEIIGVNLAVVSGKKQTNSLQQLGVFVAVDSDLHATLTEPGAETTVFEYSGVPVIARGQLATQHARAVVGLLEVAEVYPPSCTVNGIIFNPRRDIATGLYMGGLKYVELGVFNGTDAYTPQEEFDSFGVACHEFLHGEQAEETVKYPSLVNEIYAFYKTFSDLGTYPLERLEQKPGLRAGYSAAILNASRRYANIREHALDPNPEVSFFADHNIGYFRRWSDRRAASINVDIFPR